jgi:hypothetical protein
MALSVGAQEPAPTASPAMQDLLQRMSPGEGHQILARMVGKWRTSMKIWSSATPSAPPVESTGESENRMILGGRFVMEEATGSLMGMPLQRISILGYDNTTKTYTLIFYSNMETATNIATGTMDADGRTLTLRGEFVDAQGKYSFKNVTRLQGDNRLVFESYRVMPDGRELKLIEQVGTRLEQ